jgi:hypothetical protein
MLPRIQGPQRAGFGAPLPPADLRGPRGVDPLAARHALHLVEKEKAGLALNAFMALEQKTGGMRTNALDRRPQKPAAKPQDDISKKRQRQRLKRIRELMCEN